MRTGSWPVWELCVTLVTRVGGNLQPGNVLSREAVRCLWVQSDCCNIPMRTPSEQSLNPDCSSHTVCRPQSHGNQWFNSGIVRG